MNRNRKPNGYDIPLWQGSKAKVEKGWLGGPHPYLPAGDLFLNGAALEVISAFRFVPQEGEELRTAGDLKASDLPKNCGQLHPDRPAIAGSYSADM